MTLVDKTSSTYSVKITLVNIVYTIFTGQLNNGHLQSADVKEHTGAGPLNSASLSLVLEDTLSGEMIWDIGSDQISKYTFSNLTRQ